LIPFAKDRTGANEAMLGLLLLCLGLGSIIGMPMTGALVNRFGCRRVIISAGLMICAALPALGFVQSIPMLGIALLVFGAGMGIIDVAMNIQAVIVERASGRTMMSGFHGLFSVGGIAGSGGVIGLLWMGASPFVSILCVVTLALVLLGVIGPSLLPHASSDQPSQLFVWPRGKVLLIGVLCFILFLMEGAILDWSALVLTTRQGLDPSRAGLGYAVFAITMTIGRLTGDRTVSLLGSRTIMLAGGSIAMIGILVAVWSPDWPLSLFGFALVGIGAANIVPVLFSAIGHQTVMPSSLAVSAVTTLGYLGILIGPALIGPIAQISNLAIAFSGIAALLILVLLNSRIANR
jgi:predicted MFS family arabinose efflux permease